jgi:hypothetical protein
VYTQQYRQYLKASALEAGKKYFVGDKVATVAGAHHQRYLVAYFIFEATLAEESTCLAEISAHENSAPAQ